jgi:hypothetical protein
MGPAPNVAQSIDSLWLALPLKSLREPNIELLITNQLFNFKLFDCGFITRD